MYVDNTCQFSSNGETKRKGDGMGGRCFWEGGAHVSLAEEISRLDTFGWMLVDLHGIGFAFD